MNDKERRLRLRKWCRVQMVSWLEYGNGILDSETDELNAKTEDRDWPDNNEKVDENLSSDAFGRQKVR